MEKPPFLDCFACVSSSPIHHFLCLRIFSFLILVKSPRISSGITSMLSSFEHEVLSQTACGWEQSPLETWQLPDFWPTANVTYGAHISVILDWAVEPFLPMWDLCEMLPPHNHEIAEKQACLPYQDFFLQMLKILKISPVSRIFNVSIIFLLR